MFSKSTQYALKAALYLAHREDPGIPVGTAELARIINTPTQFLAKTLQKLVHANIVSSVKGSNGGVFLTKENLQTPLIAILEEISTEPGLKTCLLGSSICNPNHPCILHKDFVRVREGLNEFFLNHTLADFQNLDDAEFEKQYNWVGATTD